MELLDMILQSNELTTDVKNFAIASMGEMCLVCEDGFNPYLANSMKILM
jgi:hypothetical protein